MHDETRPDLEIEEPCPKTWSELEGAGARRFCEQCSLHVVDGSAMTRAAAADLVRASEGRVCMRLETDADGRPLHADDDAAAAHRERARRRLVAWGLSAAAGVLGACDGAPRGDAPTEPGPPDAAPGGPVSTDRPPDAERPPELLGAVCYPHEIGAAGPPPSPGAAEQPPREVMGDVALPLEPAGPDAEVHEIVGRVAVDPRRAEDATPAPDEDERAPTPRH